MDELIRKCVSTSHTVIWYVLDRVDEVGNCCPRLEDAVKGIADTGCQRSGSKIKSMVRKETEQAIVFDINLHNTSDDIRMSKIPL